VVEQAFQRERRSVARVGITKARLFTKALTLRKITLRNRAAMAPRSPRRRPGPLQAIGTTIKELASGKADFPIAGIGGIGSRNTQIAAITRQQLARVPLGAKIVGSAAVGTGAAAAIEVGTGKSPARIIHDIARAPFTGQRRDAMPRGRGLQVGQELPPSHVVVRTWQTFPGGPVFARLADGHIAVQKKDGTIKHFRPYRPVVIPRKWNARSMSRVATALKRQRKTATKILKITGGMPKR